MMDDAIFNAFPQNLTVEVLTADGDPLISEATGKAVTVTLEKARSKPRLKDDVVVGGRNAYYHFDALRGGVALPDGLETRFRFNGIEPTYELGVSSVTERNGRKSGGNAVCRGIATVSLGDQDMTFKTVTVKGKVPFGLGIAFNVKADMSEIALRPRGGAITL